MARPLATPAVEALYRACVAQTRQPKFYAEWHVPDTVEGRFDLLILHVVLVIARLRDHGDETQQLFDILFADMDKSLREMGVSDISIAKKMKPMLAAFYGRARVYQQALWGDDQFLADAVSRNVYGAHQPANEDARQLAAYVRQAHEALAAQSDEALLSGHLLFPTMNSHD